MNSEWEGYFFKITGGSTNSGTPMKQGVLAEGRKKLLLKPGALGFRSHERKGVRKRKSIAGCIVFSETAVLNLILVKKGEKDIEGLTNKSMPILRGPKRASKIAKLFKLSIFDNIKSHVIPRKVKKEGSDKVIIKKPKVMRLLDSRKNSRKRRALKTVYSKIQKNRDQKKAYDELIRALHAKKATQHASSSAIHGASKSRLSSGIIKL